MIPTECEPSKEPVPEGINALSVLLLRAQFEISMWHTVFTDTADLLIQHLTKAKQRN